DRVIEDRNVIGIDHGLYREHVRVPAERLHGAEDHGLAADGAVLLGSARAGAKAAPGCDEDGGCALGFGHWTLVAGGSGLRGGVAPSLAHSPYHVECAKTERFPI